MATYYVDPINGNNSNDGLSFANRWASLVGKTLAADDAVRVIASPDPTSMGINATFTNLSPTITLASSVTATISDCDSAWTGAANVTATVTSAASTYKQGTGGANFAIAGAFTTGKVAYFDLGSSTDFSAYEQVSLFIQPPSSIATTNWQLKLCSDATGDTPVNTFTFPVSLSSGSLHAVTFNNSGALGSNIRSVALYTLADPGAATVRLDNIIACKAASANDSLTLNSLIGKNIPGDTFYNIQSITGTTVIIGGTMTLTSGSANLRGYVGTTETVTCYKREGLMLTNNGVQTTSNFGLLTNSGTEGHPIVISGGWNRTDMSTLTGETWLLQSATSNMAFRGTDISWVNISNIKAVQFFAGFWFTNSSHMTLEDCDGQGNFVYGILFDGTGGLNTLTDCRTDLNGNYGVVLSSNSEINDLTSNGNVAAGIGFFGGGNNRVNGATIINGSSIGIDFEYNSNNFVYDLVSSSNGSTAARNLSGINYMLNASISESTEVTTSSYGGGIVYSHDHDQTPDNHFMFMDGALVSSETGADRDVQTGLAWQVDILSATRSSSYPVRIGREGDPHGIKIFCLANYQVTVSVRIKRSNTNIAAGIVCPGGQIAGVPNDVQSLATGPADAYETVSITFTPTEQGWVNIEMRAYTTDGGTTYSCWFDGVTTQSP